MPREKTKAKRLTIDFNAEEHAMLEGLSKHRSNTRAVILRKGMKILNGLDKEEYYLTTSKGERIPNSIIFS